MTNELSNCVSKGTTVTNRRDFFHSLGCLSLVGVGIAALSGFELFLERNDSYNLKESAREIVGKLAQICERHIPGSVLSISEGKDKTRLVTTATGLTEHLELARRSLAATREMLTTSCAPQHSCHGSLFYGDESLREPFIARTSSMFGPSYENETVQLVMQRCPLVRAYLAQILRDTSDELGRDARTRSDPLSAVDAVLTVNLISRLKTLADRIDDRSLLTSDNIVHLRHKTGSTSELIGRTEHFDEAQQELEQLIALRKGGTRAEREAP